MGLKDKFILMQKFCEVMHPFLIRSMNFLITFTCMDFKIFSSKIKLPFNFIFYKNFGSTFFMWLKHIKIPFLWQNYKLVLTVKAKKVNKGKREGDMYLPN